MSPAHPAVPEPLKGALNDMEAQVQSFKESLPFTAPEAIDDLYRRLQNGLANTLCCLYASALEASEEREERGLAAHRALPSLHGL